MSKMQNTTANELGWKANPEEYDLVILGGGTGGTIAAWTFAGARQRVAVIERKYVGGSCQNIACMPNGTPWTQQLKRSSHHWSSQLQPTAQN